MPGKNYELSFDSTELMDKRHPLIVTIQQAKRLIRIVVGFTVLLIGIAMIALPGPAVVVIPVGLGILATEFVWAKKLMERFKNGANSIKNTIFNNKPKNNSN